MNNELKINSEKAKSERGAALVMVLMISSLMLVACIGMLTAAAFNSKNVTDAVSEDQAYYAAESGLQATINVLRGNTSPNPLFNPTPSNLANKITFTKAVMPSTSNISSDTHPAGRLSRWLNYNYTPSGTAVADRVTLGATAAKPYTPNTGLAYSVEISDPDNTQNTVAFSTVGTFIPYDTEGDSISGKIAADGKSVTYEGSTPADTLTVSYDGQPATTLNVSSGSADTTLGNFKVTKTGNGAKIIDALRFQIAYLMSVPHPAARYIRGTITHSGISANANIDIDAGLFFLMGSNITLTPTVTSNYTKALKIPVSTTSESTTLTANVTPAEPLRVLVKSTGYGPRGARKQLEAIVQKNFFNDLSAPAALTLIGSSSGFVFNPGTSAQVSYSGEDQVSNAAIPSIGLTNSANLQTVLKTNIKSNPDPPAADVNLEVPDWLSSTYKLDETINNLRVVAKASGRYFPAGTAPGNSNFGSPTGIGITFVDGDVSLAGDGGGILVCTGKLTLNGGVDFKGLIIVTGAGGLDRNGGGNGSLAGNTVIAPYNPSNLATGFLAPKYDISGGGNSDVLYNSNSVSNGLVAISNFVLGIAEK